MAKHGYIDGYTIRTENFVSEPTDNARDRLRRWVAAYRQLLRGGNLGEQAHTACVTEHADDNGDYPFVTADDVDYLLDAVDAAEGDCDQYRAELKVEEMHAEGRECDVCTHMEYELAHEQNEALHDEVRRYRKGIAALIRQIEQTTPPPSASQIDAGIRAADRATISELRALLTTDDR